MPGPTGLTATPGDGEVTLTWDGGAVTQLWIWRDGRLIRRPIPGHHPPLVVTNLQNDEPYSFSVDFGYGSASAPSNVVVPGPNGPAAPETGPPTSVDDEFATLEGADCTVLAPGANDRLGSPAALIRLTGPPVNGQLFRYDPEQTDGVGDPVTVGDEVPGNGRLCYLTNTPSFHGTDAFGYVLVDPSTGATLTGGTGTAVHLTIADVITGDETVPPVNHPSRPTAEPGPGQATVSWTGGDVTRIDAFVEGTRVSSVTPPGGVASPYVFTGLADGDGYSYAIFSGNGYGSPPSNVIFPGVPMTPPTNLALERGPGSTVDLTWDPPADPGANPVLTYQVEYAIDGVDQPAVLVGRALEATLTADPGDEVIATVIGRNPHGRGPTSDPALLQPVLSHLDVEAPASATVGAAFDVEVAAVETDGEIATWFTGDVAITSSDATATLPADAPLTNGEGTFSLTLADPDDHTVTATGGGLTGTSDPIEVSKVAPTLVLDPSDDVLLGGVISATGTLAGGLSPTGTVTLTAYGPGDAMCAGAATFTSMVPVSGNGAYAAAPYTPEVAGGFRWRATYDGDAGNASVTSDCSTAVDVGRRPTTTTLDQPPGSEVGEVVTLTAAVAPGDATGTVTFRDGEEVLGTAEVAAGVAELDVAFETAGPHVLVAEYAGDGRSAPSASAPVEQVVEEVRKPRLRLLRTQLRLHDGAVRLRVVCVDPGETGCSGPVRLRKARHLIGETTVDLEPGARTVLSIELVLRTQRHVVTVCGPRPARVRTRLENDGLRRTPVTILGRRCR